MAMLSISMLKAACCRVSFRPVGLRPPVRLEQLNDDECAFQLTLIRGACQARQLRSQGAQAADEADRLDPVDSCDGREASVALARQLLDMAIRDPKGQVEWLGMDLGGMENGSALGRWGFLSMGGRLVWPVY